MTVAYDALTPAQKLAVQYHVNQVMRPNRAEFARVLTRIQNEKDNWTAIVQAIMSTVTGSELIPNETGQNQSGLAGIESITRDAIAADAVAMASLLTTYNSDAARQGYCKLAGAVNCLSR